MLYVGYDDSHVYALNALTGHVQWQFATNDSLLCFPALGTDGTVYFQCGTSSRVYALNHLNGTPRWIAAQDALPPTPVATASVTGR